MIRHLHAPRRVDRGIAALRRLIYRSIAGAFAVFAGHIATTAAQEPPMSTPATQPAARAHANAPLNRLINESSPYLLQHAHNPVNWYPWGDEAFKAARDLDKPIFLSIGYSTCYWCHVMERECFEDADIAKIMNDSFICIKVDREQRPDVDDIYMTGVQLMTGSGGWPMSVFLDSTTLKPFYGGTYFPPEDKFGRPGFPTVLRNVSQAWKNNRAALEEQAGKIAEAIAAQHTINSKPVALGQKQIDDAVSGLMSSYDTIDGGFGAGPRRAPKFPQPANLVLLIAGWELKPVRDAVLFTLDRMAMGGMYDHVGGGFHRYSVDEKWLVPHFEKMLYDNAQLVCVYARAYELTGDNYYAAIVRQTLAFVSREMTGKDGAFFSAQDAEVNALEGGNYLWTEADIQAAVAPDDIVFTLKVYNIDQGPNFEDPHHPEAGRKNVLFLAQRPDRLAASMGMSPLDLDVRLQKVNQALLAERSKRDQPATDDKSLAGWNGLMIAGFADGGRVLSDERYLAAARAAADAVLTKMRDPAGGLLRSMRDGHAQIDGFLEDYACMIRGLLALHRATNEKRWLDEAAKLAHAAKDRFWDASSGGYFDTREGQSDLFIRIKSVYDGAVPSGNSLMLLNLLDLAECTKDERWRDDAEASMSALSSVIADHPTGCVLAVAALRKMNGMLGASPIAATPNLPAVPDKPAASITADRPSPTNENKVVAFATPKEVTVKPGTPAAFEITTEILKGWHVNTNAPGDEFVIPLKIELTGCEGLELTPQYPPGEAFKAGGADATVQVYQGKIIIPVTLEQVGKFSGQPRLQLTYQACNDKICLEPKRIGIGLRILAQK
jgi:uncharacterized protein